MEPEVHAADARADRQDAGWIVEPRIVRSGKQAGKFMH